MCCIANGEPLGSNHVLAGATPAGNVMNERVPLAMTCKFRPTRPFLGQAWTISVNVKFVKDSLYLTKDATILTNDNDFLKDSILVDKVPVGDDILHFEF